MPRAQPAGAAPASPTDASPAPGRLDPSGWPRRHLVPLALVLAAGALAYSGALGGAWVFDDFQEIVNNPGGRDLARFAPGMGGTFPPTRAVAYLTFALCHAAFGLEPAGWKAVNVAIHLGAAVLVYALALLTLRAPRLAGSRLAEPVTARAVALAAALLFVAHPLQTQAVTYVVQRIASLAALLYLAAVVLWARFRLAPPGARRLAWYAGALVAAILASFTKEIAFTLPLAIALWDACAFGLPARRTLLALLPFALVAAAIPVTILGPGQLASTDAAGAAAAAAAVTSQAALGRLDYLATQLPVVATYLRLLALPVGQNLDHDFPVFHSFLAPAVLGAAVLLAALLALAAVLLVRARPGGPARDPWGRVVALGIGWFFLALAVESSVIPIGDVLFEHRVYLPSAGIFLAVAAAGGALATRVARDAGAARRTIVAGALVLAAVLGAATFARNRVWRDEVTLWTDAAAKSPGKPRPHLNAGQALAERGDLDAAIAHYQRALAVDPAYPEAQNNLGVAYFRKGMVDHAIVRFQAAIELDPDYGEAHMNLGIAYGRKGFVEDARREIEAGMRLGRDRSR